MDKGDYQTETLAFETNYKPNVYGMDENLLDYLNGIAKNNENSNEMNQDLKDLTLPKKKSGNKSSDFNSAGRNLRGKTGNLQGFNQEIRKSVRK